jgi:hypothetical protein
MAEGRTSTDISGDLSTGASVDANAEMNVATGDSGTI